MFRPRRASPLIHSLAVPAVIVALAAGCAGDNGGNGDGNGGQSRTGERIGTIVGAIGGALLGSRVGGDGTTHTLGAIAGGALGAYLGGNLGRMFDDRDRRLQAGAADEAMTRPAGHGVSWSNPDSGNSGTVTPLTAPSKEIANGKTCRTFEQQVHTADGRTAASQGTACRQPDGTWRVVSG